MIKLWQDGAWEDYLYWQMQDKKTLKRINKLLQDIERNGYSGIGKPEPLKGDLRGFWSVQISLSTITCHTISFALLTVKLMLQLVFSISLFSATMLSIFDSGIYSSK